MGIRTVCREPHPVLRARARPVEQFSDELQRLARDLIETMYAHDGIGIAAPQVGSGVQLFVASPTQERGRELVVVNPVLVAASGSASVVEGCLSVPQAWERVKRASSVRMRGQDLSGKPLEIEAGGLLAIVLQHELDHLQGRLFIDRLPWLRRQRIRFRLAREPRSRPALRAQCA
jgi:peptide deformylase